MFVQKVVTFLLPLVGVCGNYFELSELIQRIHKESDSATVNFIGIDGRFLDYFVKRHNDIPVAIFTSLPEDVNESFYNDSAILVVEAQSENHQYFEMLERIVLRLRMRKFVIISATSLKNLRQYFSYFTENKFTRIFGLTMGASYAYLPYADNPVQQISKKNLLPDALTDLNGFAIRTTVQKDIPRVFWYPDKQGLRQIGGCFGQIFINFLRRHNATFKEIFINNSSDLFMPGVIKAIRNNQVDISMNIFIPTNGLGYSYPVKFVGWTIMVPPNDYVNPNEYFLRPFSLTTWIFIGVTLIYIILMDVIKDVFINSTADVWHSFSRIFLAMLNSPAERPTTAYRFHSQVLLLAFILGNIYVIYFTSFLTVFIKAKQHETMQDLIDNNVHVILLELDYTRYMERNYVAGLEKILVPVNPHIYFTKVYSMQNTRFAYLLSKDRAEFIIGLQKYFVKPLFHTTRESLNHYNIGFLLAPHSPFEEVLSYFIIHIKETGLMEKWDYDAIGQAQKAGFKVDVDRKPSEAPPVPLTLDHLRFAWTCLTIGLTLAFVVFMIEKFVKSVKKFRIFL